jgi:hypothetical protein
MARRPAVPRSVVLAVLVVDWCGPVETPSTDLPNHCGNSVEINCGDVDALFLLEHLRQIDRVGRSNQQIPGKLMDGPSGQGRWLRPWLTWIPAH